MHPPLMKTSLTLRVWLLAVHDVVVVLHLSFCTDTVCTHKEKQTCLFTQTLISVSPEFTEIDNGNQQGQKAFEGLGANPA